MDVAKKGGKRVKTLSLLLFHLRLPEQLLSARRQARPHKVTSRQLKRKGAVFTTQWSLLIHSSTIYTSSDYCRTHQYSASCLTRRILD